MRKADGGAVEPYAEARTPASVEERRAEKYKDSFASVSSPRCDRTD
jgi:hypothetical protein